MKEKRSKIGECRVRREEKQKREGRAEEKGEGREEKERKEAREEREGSATEGKGSNYVIISHSVFLQVYEP